MLLVALILFLCSLIIGAVAIPALALGPLDRKWPDLLAVLYFGTLAAALVFLLVEVGINL